MHANCKIFPAAARIPQKRVVNASPGAAAGGKIKLNLNPKVFVLKGEFWSFRDHDKISSFFFAWFLFSKKVELDIKI